jgi:hypothetical protein
MDLALPGSGTQASGAAGSTPPWAMPTQTGVVINNTLAAVNGGNSLEQLRNAVLANTILNTKTKQALITLLDAAGTDVSKARDNIEGWYNSTMDRVSGWYKRRTQAIVAIVALIAAAGVNVDSVTLVNTLSTDQSVRDSLISAVQEQAKHGGTPQENQYTPGTQGCGDPKGPDCRITANIGQLKALGIPIGWTSEPFEKNHRGIPSDFGSWLLKIVGWLLTAFAACLGAPFWFDMLNKFIVVRSTVKPHEKSPEETSKA